MTQTKQGIKIGDEMEDGTTYVGTSPDTHNPMYAMPVDERLPYTLKGAAAQSAVFNMMNALGHDDWRVPTIGELDVLRESRNEGRLKGTFNESGENPRGWYWSSTEISNSYFAHDQRFSDGRQGYLHTGCLASLRFVRG